MNNENYNKSSSHEEIFNERTTKVNELFESVFPTFEAKKSFLSNIHSKELSLDKLDTSDREKIDLAVKLLIENARTFETRKMQQIHFGAALAILRQDPTKIVSEIKNNDKFFIQMLQLSVIFLHNPELDEEHNHDHIRAALLKALKEVNNLL